MTEAAPPNPDVLSPALLRTPIAEPASLLVSREWGRWFQASWGRQGGAQAPSNAELGTDLDHVETELAQVEEDLAQTQAELAQVQAELAQVQAELAAVQAELAALDAEVAALSSAVETLQSDLAALILVVETLEGQVAALDATVTALQGDVTTLQGQVTGLEGDLTALEGQVAILETAVAGLDAEVTTLQGQVTTLQSDLTALSSRVTTLEGQVTTLQSDLLALTTRVTALEASTTSGTWTPTLFGNTVAGTNTYHASGRSGFWTRHGSMVWIEGVVIVTAVDPAMAGILGISGLPFPPRATTVSGLALADIANVTWGTGTQLTASIGGGNTPPQVQFFVIGSGTGFGTQITQTSVTAFSSFYFSGWYPAA